MKLKLTTFIPTLLIAFAFAGSTQAQRFLSYEPEVVELDGRLVIQSKYGPSNFGEQPKTDQKVNVPILLLSQRAVVTSREEDGKEYQTADNVRQIQLAFAGSSETSHKALIGKPVVVTGTLFRAHTGHHYTDVVLNVQSIERKPAGYDKRPFVVCGINTSEWYIKQRYGSSIFLHAQFHLTVGEDEMLRSFRHAKSGLLINTGVQFLYDTYPKPPKPREIRIALSASAKEEDALHTSDNAVAGADYGRNWGRLYVTKQVVVGDTEYTLTLYCFDPHRSGNK